MTFLKPIVTFFFKLNFIEIELKNVTIGLKNVTIGSLKHHYRASEFFFSNSIYHKSSFKRGAFPYLVWEIGYKAN